MNRENYRTARSMLTAVLALLFAGIAPTIAEPPTERMLVQAVADANEPRILIRWLQVEGITRRYDHYDVLRRRANELSFTQLNVDPIGALTTVEAIEQVFTDPGRADALTMILDSLGPDYATDLLEMQDPELASAAQAQLTMLPDLNYGAALALGLGYMDEPVEVGESYVYEVWGLDELGFRVERLGQVSATEGVAPALMPVQNLECVDLGDERADMAAFLRWNEATPNPDSYTVGYDLLRARRNPDSSCPTIEPGAPGVFKANTYPTFTDAPGRPAEGAALFATHCAGCHGGRNDPTVAGSTEADFRRLQYPKILPSPGDAKHSGLNGIGADTLQRIYEWIGEFQYRDGADETPADPLERQTTYCYKVMPRTLLGDYGEAGNPVQCEVRDRVAPGVPYAVRSTRVVHGKIEQCEISWERNSGPDDDTASYYLYRADEVPRWSHQAPAPASYLAKISQPTGGTRISHEDDTLDILDAGQSFFYAVRSEDDAGNLSSFSGWAPCVPRDIVPPSDATLSADCEPCLEHCRDLGQDQDWLDAGGDPELWFVDDPENCKPWLQALPGDAFGYRLLRSFDGAADSYLPGRDFTGPIIADLEPMIDEIAYYKVQPYDKSGNFAPPTNPIKFLFLGAKLPAPQIIFAAELLPAGKIQIKFRSLQPDRLLGFALYKEYQGPEEDTASGAELIVRYDETSLGDETTQGSGWWARKSGAVTLDEIPGFIRTTDPSADTFLYYNDLDQYYVLQDDAAVLQDLVLRLRAIGKSGQEGLDNPFHWDPSTPADTVLDWPRIRDSNRGGDAPVLNVSYAQSPDRMLLEWSAAPEGCAGYPDFIVFRKRGSSNRWQQISPPFACDLSAPQAENMSFTDTDVQPGFEYTYTVIRLYSDGEFSRQFGPTSQTATNP